MTTTAACSSRLRRAADVDLRDVGEFDAAAIGRDDLAQRSLELRARVRSGGRDEAHRRDAVDETIRVELLEKRERPTLHRPEQLTLFEGFDRVADRRPIWRQQWPDQFADVSLQRALLVARVPNQRDAAAGTENAVQFRDRLIVSEPVERLSDRDRVDAVVRERDRFRGTAQRLD